MKRLRGHLTYANVISTLCLCLLVGGGTAYAATQLPKNSVGTKQLKKEAVTPAKLSTAAKAALVGKEGPKGERGEHGERGHEGVVGPQGPAGPQGPTGPAGTTGVEPLVVDAGSGEAAPAGAVALSGPSSWTTGPGQAGLLFGEVTATGGLSRKASEEFALNCFVTITVFDNGVEAAQASLTFYELTFQEKKVKITPVGIAFHEPGTQTITASASSFSCEAGTKINNLSVAVAPVG